MTANLRVKNDKYYVVLTHTTDCCTKSYRNPCRKCIVSTAQTLLALQIVQNGKKDPCHESRGPRIIQQYSLFSSSRFQAVYIETLVTNDIVVAIVIDLYAGTHPAGFAAIIRQ